MIDVGGDGCSGDESPRSWTYLGQACEYVAVEDSGAIGAVDAFDQHVLGRLCGLGMPQFDAATLRSIPKDGNISAEHGVGLLKKPYLRYTRSVAEI